MQLDLIIKKNKKGLQKKPLFIVVGRGVSKKATERNNIKRKIRSIVQPLIKDFKYDVTIVTKKGKKKKEYKELKREILQIFNHERIIS